MNAAPASTRDARHGRGGRLTSDVAGIGGRLRDEPEDFLVDEQPLYQPSGSGEHLYLLVQKRNMTTAQAAGVVARHFGVRPSAVGHAGLKDRRAVTRQVMSVHIPGKKPEDFPELRHDRLSVLWADLHTNKLRQGHLRGNRFSIKVRGVEATAALRAKQVLDRLAREGAPNYAGEQRFGTRGNNAALGRFDLLGDAKGLLDSLLGPVDGVEAAAWNEAYTRGDYRGALEASPRELRVERAALEALARGASAEQAAGAIDPTQRRFWVAAFQSEVFNGVLSARMEAGAIGSLMEGDLAWKHANGAVFAVHADTLSDPETRARLGAIEISATGPLWGLRMARAAGLIGELELAALEATGVTIETMESHAARTGQPITGARRPVRAPVIDPEVEGGVDERGAYVRCAFELPAGAFASVVMDEVMKAGPASGAGEGVGVTE